MPSVDFCIRRCSKSETAARRLLACCFVTCLTLLVLGTGCGITQAQDVPRPAPQVAEKPKLLTGAELRIHHGSVDEDKSISSISIDLGMLGLTPDVRVTWNPREAAKNVKLTCQITGESLTVGTDDSSDIRLEYDPEPITKDKSALLELRVPHPERIKPGVYSGEAVFQFRGNPDKFNAVVPARWPIRIVASGRILKENCVTFTHAGNGVLNVGHPATVTVAMHTMGCEPGQGTLKLRFTPLGGQPRPLLTMPVSFVDGIRDPLVDLRDAEYVCPEWRSAVVNVITKSQFEPGDTDLRKYTMEFRSGDCFVPGKIEAELTWPQAAEAPDTAEKEFNRSRTADVEGGIIVAPRLAFDTETVHLLVVSRKNLGPQCDLVLINEDSLPVTVTLSPFTASDDQNASKEVVYQYYAGFKPQQLGPWQVTWSESAREEAGEAAQPAEFTVWGRMVNHLEEFRPPSEPRMPVTLRVFASETPILWNQIYGDDEGRGYYQYRLHAFELGIARQYVRDARLRPVSIYRGVPERPDEISRWNPDQHPYLLISPDSAQLQGGDAQSTRPAGSFGSPEAQRAVNAVGNSDGDTPALPGEIDVAFPEEGLLPFNVYCAVAPVVGEHPRKAVTDHDFVYRALITGTDGAGLPIARIVEFPFRVEVTDHWVYYRKWFVWVVMGIVSIAILFLLWRFGNKEPRSKGLAMAGGGSMMDDMPELFGVGSSSASENNRGSAAGNSGKSESRQNNDPPSAGLPSSVPAQPPLPQQTEIDKDLMDDFL